jgi:hypothetical protein
VYGVKFKKTACLKAVSRKLILCHAAAEAERACSRFA